ncbi:MAG: uracil-DNA glycosylase [Gemmatimonadetes bacterium]|nr:uracil-DNA glycosylase [Gemmatimonadota bacterium]
MDAKDRLRQYLEQRKELGEQDLVLDGLTVEDTMKLLGAPVKASPRARASAPAEPSPPVETGRYAFPGRYAQPEPATSAPPPVPHPSEAKAGPRLPPQPSGPITIGASVSDAARATFAAKIDSLDALAAAVAACKLCGLHATATNPVPGEGSPDAKFVCVGEAPGATEDETGRPFVGAAGQLLTKILDAIKFRREDVFICNVLKHRPPGNRNPAPDEIAACSPYLLQQLALLKPRVILALGTFAAQTLLQTSLPLSKLRGQTHRFYGVPLVVTYHPAALLRNPNWKRPTWEDVQLARRVFDNASGVA